VTDQVKQIEYTRITDMTTGYGWNGNDSDYPPYKTVWSPYDQEAAQLLGLPWDTGVIRSLLEAHGSDGPLGDGSAVLIQLVPADPSFGLAFRYVGTHFTAEQMQGDPSGITAS
jgi:hypothetical protein